MLCSPALLLSACVCFVAGGPPGICMCVCVLCFLVNSAEGGKAMPGLYPLQSLVSIIEEWYLQRGTGVRGRAGEEGWREEINRIKKERREGSCVFVELLPYL